MTVFLFCFVSSHNLISCMLWLHGLVLFNIDLPQWLQILSLDFFLQMKTTSPALIVFALLCVVCQDGHSELYKKSIALFLKKKERLKTRFSWLNCALWDDEAVCWVSIGYCEALAVGNWWYLVSRGHLCLYILHNEETWTGVTDALRTDRLWKIGLLSSL